MPVEKMVQEFENAEKPFNLYMTKMDDIIKTVKTVPPEQLKKEMQILNSAFSKFLENTKREDVRKLATAIRVSIADSFIKGGDRLFKEFTDTVFKKYNAHLDAAGVDVTDLTKTVNETARAMKKFGSELKYLASNPEAFNQYINDNLPGLIEQKDECLSKTTVAFAKAAEKQELTKTVGSAIVAAEVTLLLTPLVGTSTIGGASLGATDVVIMETLKGTNIKDIPPSYLALGMTIGALSPVVAEKLTGFIIKGAERMAAKGVYEAATTSTINAVLIRLRSFTQKIAQASEKTVEHAIEVCIDAWKTYSHAMHGSEGGSSGQQE